MEKKIKAGAKFFQTHLFALDNPAEDGGDDAEGDFDDGLGE